MSSTSTSLPSTCADSASSQDLIMLKEEEKEAEVNTTANLVLDELADPKKSKNTVWIEGFLTKYYQRQKGGREVEEVNQNVDQIVTVTVNDFEIDRVEPPPPEELQAVLSDILSLKVRYKVAVPGSGGEDKESFFVVKVPPTNTEDRQLVSLANVNEREVAFYTQVIPTIQDWCGKKGVKMEMGTAPCFLAHLDRPLEEEGIQDLIEDLSRAESTIVLGDLRRDGFAKRHFSEPLSLAEVKKAVEEIGKVHAYSWVIQRLSGEPLKTLWPFYYKTEYEAMLYETLLEDGFPLLEKHLKDHFEVNQDFDLLPILTHLETFQKQNVRTILLNLLTPAEEPSPTVLCHMDFWSDNIFFRSRKTTDSDESRTIDCRIVDWQMFSIGRPTHDLALLLFTSLSAQTRKEETIPLLEFYLGVFQSVAHKFNLTIPFDLACLQAEYCQSQLLALLQIIASVDLALHDEGTQERLVDALQDVIQADII